MKYSIQMVKIPLSIILILCFLTACKSGNISPDERVKRAEQYFEAIYGGTLSGLDNLVSEHVVSTYPVYEEILGSKAIRGRDELKEFATGFNRRWKDPWFKIHEAISDGKRVVLVWSFRAKRVNIEPDSSMTDGQEYSWGGITLFHFNASGKITEEIGEESSPGPMARLAPED